MTDRPVVLDASALLALLADEPGAQEVASLLGRAVISAPNLSEVVAKLADAGMPAGDIREAFATLGLPVVDFDEEHAHAAGLLRPKTRSLGLSLGDRACLATAARLGAEAVTTDRAWKRVRGDVRVRVVR